MSRRRLLVVVKHPAMNIIKTPTIDTSTRDRQHLLKEIVPIFKHESILMCRCQQQRVHWIHINISSTCCHCVPDMSNTTFFYPNINTQYSQRGLNNAQYQYQFFDESLTIAIPIPKSLKYPNITQYQYQYLNNFVVFVPKISSSPKVY